MKIVCTTMNILPTTQYKANAAGNINANTVIIIGIMYNIIFICGLSEDGLSAIINFCCKKVAPPANSGKMKSPVAPNSNHKKVRSEEHTSELQSRGHLVC